MTEPIRIRLTAAQRSALECSGVDLAPADPTDAIVARAWQGSILSFAPEDRDALFTALVSLSNAEDAIAEDRNGDPQMRQYARRASRSLSAIASRVLTARARLTDSTA